MSRNKSKIKNQRNPHEVKWKHPGNLLECDYCDRKEICCCKCNNRDKCLGAILRKE